MNPSRLLQNYLSKQCDMIHSYRLSAVLDVASGLQKSQNLSLSSMGRNMEGTIDVKHKIKKVDRLESNEHLHSELEYLYEGLSSYIFEYISTETGTPIIVDLCYLQDNRKIQMLSAEIPLKGRSLSLFRDVFESGDLRGRAVYFINKLKGCIPEGKEVVIVMDAGFGEDWFEAIEALGWSWLVRVRQGKKIKLKEDSEWLDMKDFFNSVGTRAKHYERAYIMKEHERPCRIIAKKNILKNTKDKYKKQPRNYKAANGDFSRAWKEPWVLATNLTKDYDTVQILNFYKQRMQIEESFRDLKSHRYGISARYVKTECVKRWGVKMVLGAIVQIIYWIIGVIAHSQDYQRVFQANTVKDKKIFSYFYLGKLMFEHDKVKELDINKGSIAEIIKKELARIW